MAEEHSGEALTEAELSDLARKLKAFGSELTPKERWFLAESLKSGIVAKRADEIEAYTLSSTLQGEFLYQPGQPQPTPTPSIIFFE